MFETHDETIFGFTVILRRDATPKLNTAGMESGYISSERRPHCCSFSPFDTCDILQKEKDKYTVP